MPSLLASDLFGICISFEKKNLKKRAPSPMHECLHACRVSLRRVAFYTINGGEFLFWESRGLAIRDHKQTCVYWQTGEGEKVSDSFFAGITVRGSLCLLAPAVRVLPSLVLLSLVPATYYYFTIHSFLHMVAKYADTFWHRHRVSSGTPSRFFPTIPTQCGEWPRHIPPTVTLAVGGFLGPRPHISTSVCLKSARSYCLRRSNPA